MTKKELALETFARLKKEYPDAGCTLEYEDAWKLLISVRLAAQCTDARVNQVVPGLYEKFPTISALADADESDIEEIVRPCGLGKSKARDIKACMTMLRDEYDCKVPDDFNKLLKLPGVMPSQPSLAPLYHLPDQCDSKVECNVYQLQLPAFQIHLP